MDTALSLPVALSLFSALTLAFANVAVKRGGDILLSRCVMAVTAALILLPAAFLVPLPDAATWAALAWSLPAHFLYQSFMIRALHRGDLSLVFPVMRGLAPLLTALAAFLVLGEALSPAAIAGLLVATLSVVVFALPAGGGSLLRQKDAGALGWAALTALGIALYSVADARGVRIAPNAFTFIVWLFLLDWIGVTAVGLATRRRALLDAMRLNWRAGALAGLFSILSFGAALYAFRFMEAARVSALRETAVVFAALLGWRYLGEGFGLRRTLAAAALAAGLVLMQLG